MSVTALSSIGGHSLDKIDFLQDGEVVATDTSSPYSVTGPSSNTPNGDYLVSARATYGSGAVVVDTNAASVAVANDPCPADDDAEDNDDRPGAAEAAATFEGVICEDDSDYFEVELDDDETIEVTVTQADGADDLDVKLLSETSLLETAETAQSTEVISFTSTSTGTYYVKVFGHSSTGEGAYLATITSDVTEAQEEADENTGPAFPYRTIGMGGANAIWRGLGDIRSDYEDMIDGGVTHVREDFFWNLLQTSPTGAIDFDRTDNIMEAAAREGMSVLAILNVSTYDPNDPEDGTSWQMAAGFPRVSSGLHPRFVTFAEAISRRYGPGGSFWSTDCSTCPSGHRLRSVEILNEPWYSTNWGTNDCPIPSEYADLVHITAERLSGLGSTAPTDILMSGDLEYSWEGQPSTCVWGYPVDDRIFPRWVDTVLDSDHGLEQFITAYSIHPYPAPGGRGPRAHDAADPGDNFDRIRLIRERIDDSQEFPEFRPIWITEIGWSTGSAFRPATAVDESKQKIFIRRAITDAFRRFTRIDRTYVYSWAKDSPPGPGEDDSEHRYFGVRRSNGNYKPSWIKICVLALGTTGCSLD